MKSTVAQCAALIRADLKSLYPGVKFSVTSESFSMGNSVNVSYTDGPTIKDVESHIKKYQYGHFNGMEDMYETSNRIEGLAQTKYLTVSRNMSPEIKEKLTVEVQSTSFDNESDFYVSDLVYRKFVDLDLYKTETTNTEPMNTTSVSSSVMESIIINAQQIKKTIVKEGPINPLGAFISEFENFLSITYTGDANRFIRRELMTQLSGGNTEIKDCTISNLVTKMMQHEKIKSLASFDNKKPVVVEKTEVKVPLAKPEKVETTTTTDDQEKMTPEKAQELADKQQEVINITKGEKGKILRVEQFKGNLCFIIELPSRTARPKITSLFQWFKLV